MKYTFLIVVVLLSIFSMAKACDEPMKNEPRQHIIEIKNFAFVPAQVKVAKGDKVIWINRDTIPHNIVNQKNAHVLSKTLEKGDKFTFIVQKDMNYACGFHPSMLGSLQLNK